MKCSHCSAELPASATQCIQCGQNVQSTGQFVPANNYQSNAFSYLPADTPPWPTAIPEKIHAQNQTNSALVTSQTKSDVKPKRSLSTVLTMTAMVLLVPLIGAALTMGALFAKGQIGTTTTTVTGAAKIITNTAQPTPTAQTATNQLPTPTSSKKISDADLNILLQYPDNWDPEQINKSTTDTTLAIHPHQQLPINFYVIHMTDTLSSQFQTADDVNQARLQVMEQQQAQGITNVQPVQSTNTQPTIGGTQWSTQEASFLVNGSSKFHLTIISTQHNKSYYTLMFWIPDVYYNEAMSKYIQPMLQSIQFIK